MYFFDDGVPVGHAEGGRTPLQLPLGADEVVAERPFALWTGRSFLAHAWPDVKETPESTASQRVDVEISPPDDHFTDANFVVHVHLPRTDVRGRAYLDAGYSPANLVYLLTPLSIDGAWISAARDLAVDSVTLTSSALTMDVRGSVVVQNLAGARGMHRIAVIGDAENPIELHVGLHDERFTSVHPFDPAPSLIAGPADASWKGLLTPKDAVTVWVEPTTPLPLPQRARVLVYGFNLSAFAPLLFVLVIAWQIAGMLFTSRLSPFGEGRPQIRAVFALVSACATYAFALLAYFFGTKIQGGAPPLAVAVLAVMAIGMVYALAKRNERAVIAGRPAVAIATLFLLVYFAFRYEVGLVQSGPGVAWIGESFLSLVTFGLATVVGLIALAPRLLVLASRLDARSGRIVYGACVAAVVLSAAVWRPLLRGDAAHYLLPIAMGEPYEAGFEVLRNVVVVALPIVGLLALISGSRGRQYMTRGVTFAGIVVLLALWCVGLDGDELAFPPALIALATIPLFALRPRIVCNALSQHLQPLGPSSETLFKEAALRADLDVAARTLRQLREKFLAGDLDFATYNTRSLELTQFMVEESRGLTPVKPEVGKTTMFAAFTLRDPLRSARQAGFIGAVLSAVTIFVAFDVLKDVLGESSLPVMYLLAWSLHAIARGAVAAFVFVYFLPYLRGGMATTKGLFLAFAAVVAIAPATVLLETWHHAVATLITAALFFPLVGAVLDTIGLVQHAESVSMMRIFSFANLRTIAAIGGVLIAAIANAMTGGLTQAAESFVGAAVHTPGSIGGGPLARGP